MQFLATTAKKLILYDNGKQTAIDQGNFYGLTWDNNKIYASINNPHDHGYSEIKVYDKSFNHINTHPKQNRHLRS